MTSENPGNTERSEGPRRGGDAPPSTGGRILATAAHLNLALPLLIGVLIAIGTGELDDAGVGAFWLTLLAIVATLVLRFASRGMAQSLNFQAKQAFWWGLPAAIIAYIVALLAQNVIFAVILLLPSVVISCLAVGRILGGDGYRYPYVADWLEADK